MAAVPAAAKRTNNPTPIMLDQAHDLRKLAVRRRPSAPVSRGGILAVAGGGGVGTTTLAINLAVASAEAGRRTLFAAPDSNGSEPALPRAFLFEANQDRGNIGPFATADHLPEMLVNGNLDADLTVVDAGDAREDAELKICRRANVVLMITTPAADSVVNTFAALKRINHADPIGRFFLLINKAPHAEAAGTAYRRLARASGRLLGVRLDSAGRLPAVAAEEGKNSANLLFGLNIRLLSVDSIRDRTLAEVPSKWRRRAESDGSRQPALATALEMDF